MPAGHHKVNRSDDQVRRSKANTYLLQRLAAFCRKSDLDDASPWPDGLRTAPSLS